MSEKCGRDDCGETKLERDELRAEVERMKENRDRLCRLLVVPNNMDWLQVVAIVADMKNQNGTQQQRIAALEGELNELKKIINYDGSLDEREEFLDTAKSLVLAHKNHTPMSKIIEKKQEHIAELEGALKVILQEHRDANIPCELDPRSWGLECVRHGVAWLNGKYQCPVAFARRILDGKDGEQ